MPARSTTKAMTISVRSGSGLPMTAEMRRARESGVLERLPAFERITPTGVVWPDGRTAEADTLQTVRALGSAPGAVAADP